MKKSLMKTVALGMALSFCVASTSFAAGGSIVDGNVSVYKGGELVSTLSGKNPIEDGVLFICKDRCMVKSEGISLVGADASKIAVDSEKDSFKLYLKEGRVDYTITNNSRSITFVTPDGAYSVADVVFDAASKPVVRGSVMVDANGATQITVSEGSLVFATADGMKAISAGNKIVLAVNPAASGAAVLGSGSGSAAAGAAAVGAGAATAGAGAAAGLAGMTIGGISLTTVAVGAVATVGAVAVGATVIDDDDDDTKASAPASVSSRKKSQANATEKSRIIRKPSSGDTSVSPSK